MLTATEELALSRLSKEFASGGRNLEAELFQLGKAVASGDLKPEFRGPTSRLGAFLGKAQADGAKEAAPLLIALGILRTKQVRPAQGHGITKTIDNSDDCNRREIAALATHALSRLRPATTDGSEKAPDSLASTPLAARTTNDRNDPSTTN